MNETATQTVDTPTEATGPSFADFGLDERILGAIAKLGFETPTPIQQVAIPALLEGRDVLGGARTGSGKTGAFGLPMIHKLAHGPKGVKALVLAPTRELAIQVADALKTFSAGLPVRGVTIYGGVPYDGQLKALKSGVPIVVGTPGRIIDHIERGNLDLSGLEYLVLDEADEMLRMGFIEAVQQIMRACPGTQQNALFSATMPDAIRDVAQTYLTDPLQLEVEDSGNHVDHIEQTWIPVRQSEKMNAIERILRAETGDAMLIFARTRRGCAEIAENLAKRGLPVDALHGDLSQAARERVLMRLRSGGLKILAATDVAARGIDVQHITHVINFDLPDDAETYVHRIGRTGRAGREGHAISLVGPRDRRKFNWIQRDIGHNVEQVQLPSERAISIARRNQFVEELTTVAAGEIDDVREFIGSLDLSAEDLAAAAVKVLLGVRDVSLTDPVEIDEPVRRAANEAQLAIHAGMRHRVRPGDIVGALAGETGLKSEFIGKIQVMQHITFVGMAAADAERIAQAHQTIQLRGQDVDIELARPRDNRRKPPMQRDPERYADRGDRNDGDRREFRGRGPRREGGFQDRPYKSKGRRDDAPRREGGFQDRPYKSKGDHSESREGKRGTPGRKPWGHKRDDRGDRADRKPFGGKKFRFSKPQR